MEFVFQRTYRGQLKAVILDWAGTTVDYGCFAPVAAFMRVFEAQGVPITVAQARAPMGLGKRDHIRAIAAMEPVAAQWQAVFKRPCQPADIDALHQTFESVLLDSITEHADVIPGTLEATADLRARGILIGSTTGYTRTLMARLVPEVKRRGYAPDWIVCVDEVPAGRPAPWMALQCMMDLGVYPAEAIVKIGDTVPDIQEGLNAGMWTIGVIKTGNEFGLSEQEIAALDKETFAAKRDQVVARFAQAGAHYVVDSIGDCIPLIDEINTRLARGARP